LVVGVMGERMSDHQFDIIPVLIHYGAARVPDTGGWRRMRCPFHGDGTPSAGVNPSDGVFNCFGCDVSGDAIAIIQRVERCEFISAVEKYERITGDKDHGVSATARSVGYGYDVHGREKKFEAGHTETLEDWLRR
jgi:hypothetical protein